MKDNMQKARQAYSKRVDLDILELESVPVDLKKEELASYSSIQQYYVIRDGKPILQTVNIPKQINSLYNAEKQKISEVIRNDER